MVDHDLDVMVAALRDDADGAPIASDPTRRRVLASVERTNVSRRRHVAVVMVALTLGTATLSWAATTGRLQPVLQRLGIAPRLRPAPPPAMTGAHPSTRRFADGSVPAPLAIVPAPLAIVPAPLATAPAMPSAGPARPATVARVRSSGAARDLDAIRYRRAHALHFHGGAPVAALAAWDAYLAAAPRGGLALEARYNRGLTLARLGRWAEAQAALAPFVRGEVAPSGYRQREAAALAAAIARRLAPEPAP